MIKDYYLAFIEFDSRKAAKRFGTHLTSNGMGYWNYIDNCWIISTKPNQTKAEELRDHINLVNVQLRVNFVTRIEFKGDWAGTGNEDMFAWFKNIKKLPNVS